jgi:predicted nuclease of predicted toxin-antitoxin system
MRFLADVNVSRVLVERLREAGLDIHRVPEIMDGRSTDPAVLLEARRRSAILISHDQDFSALRAIAGDTAPSLISLRTSYVAPERIARVIIAVIAATAADLAAGELVTVDDARVRVHLLPITSPP